MLRPFVAPYAATLGAGSVFIGLVVAGMHIPGLFLAVPFGALSDRWGPRRLSRFGLAMLSGGAGLLALSDGLPTVLVSQLIIGVGTIGCALALQASATQDTNATEHDPRRVTAFSTFVLAGHLLGPVLAGYLTDSRGHEAAFAAVSALVAVSLLGTFRLPAWRTAASLDSDTASASGRLRFMARSVAEPYSGARHLARTPAITAVISASALAVTMSHLRTAFLPLHFEALGWPSVTIGLVLSVAAGAGLVSRAVHSYIDRRLPTWLYMAGSLVLGSAALGLAVATPSLTIIVASVAVSGFMLGAANPISLTLLARLVSQQQRSLSVGLRLTGNRLGTAVAPIIFGLVAAITGVQLALGLIAAAVAGSGGFLCRHLRR